MEEKETNFDKKIDKAADVVADVVKDVAKDINHATDAVADAVGDLGKAVVDLVGGHPAKHDADVDPADKMGK